MQAMLGSSYILELAGHCTFTTVPKQNNVSTGTFPNKKHVAGLMTSARVDIDGTCVLNNETACVGDR